MRRPNIVFIMSDDHAPHALGCYGSQIAKTPNLDKLAGQGLRFNHAYDTVALCGPSRAAFLTGKYSHINGFKQNHTIPFDGSQPTFPKYLQQAGYQTGIFGKWHLDSEPTGFDHYSLIPGHGEYWNPPLMQPDQPWVMGDVGDVPEGTWDPYETEGYLTEIITDQSIDWMQKSSAQDQPFCAIIHHKAPHTQYQYPERYEDLYKDDLPYPETFDDDYEGRKALKNYDGRWCKMSKANSWDLQGNELGHQPVKSWDDPDFKKWCYQIMMKGYFRLVASLDDSIGRIMDYLDDSGLADNTIVIYTSDNGYFLGDHGLFNKMWMYEESMGIPLIIRYPQGIQTGQVSDELVSLIDLAPTFLDYAGHPVPEDLQGQTLRPLLETGQWNAKDAHYYHYYTQMGVPSQCGVRTKDNKLICFYELDESVRWELYDLRNDPRELHNLAGKAKYSEIFEAMKTQLHQSAIRYEDPVVAKIWP